MFKHNALTMPYTLASNGHKTPRKQSQLINIIVVFIIITAITFLFV